MATGHEPLEIINKRLHDTYGETEEKGVRLPNFRIVWSEDQREKRLMEYTDEGFQLMYPEVREVPKYRQWIKQKWVIERLTHVPVFDEKTLPTGKLSYEPIWVFEDAKGRPLPPNWVIAKFCIDGIHKAMEQAGVYTKYKDHNETPEEIEARLKEIEDHLYSNESIVGDALATKNAISMAGLDGRNVDGTSNVGE